MASDPAVTRDPEASRLLRAISALRGAATPQGKLALDALAAEIEAKIARHARRQERAP